MSLTGLIPGRNRGKHDPDTVIRKLRDENAKLLNRQAAADDFFAILFDDVTTTNAALKNEKEHRQQAEQGLVEAWERIAQLESEKQQLLDELAPHRAAEANANAIDVPPAERDTSAMEDQATAPIDVRSLREAADLGLLGPVVRVSDSGASADPAATQPIPRITAA
ncbi:hypothetical protein [Streptomyces sp. cg35]|uniref:hypothetical protein n=1 Tax=Streptomyces sp. cg35 TaxID=3421650 RepID=UPI003D17124D